jgi:hypothetical protein
MQVIKKKKWIVVYLSHIKNFKNNPCRYTLYIITLYQKTKK